VGMFIARRLVVSFFILLVSTFLMFVLVANSGDPLDDLYGDNRPGRELRLATRIEQLNLDQPVPQRYTTWLGGVAKCAVPGQGCDLGLNVRNQDVSVLLGQAVSSTLRLVVVATVLSILVGVGIGIVTALRQYSGFDYTVTFSAFLFFSLPVFWVAVLFKQFLAIGVNDWYGDPSVNPIPATIAAGLCGVAWGAIIGGDARRTWIVRAGASTLTLAVLLWITWSGWVQRPSLGPAVIAVLAFGAALASTALISGLGNKPVLYAALATAGIGSVSQFFVTPLLQDPRWASWPTLFAALLVGLVVAAACGYLLGRLDRPQAIGVSMFTAVLTGSFIVADILLRQVPTYSRRVNGRILPTVGSETPNLGGGFWLRQTDVVTHLFLPTLVLMVVSVAVYSRYSRATMLETMNQDYVRTARSKGLTERTVIMRHAFRNALIPITTLVTLDFGSVIGGAVITETVFGWPGMGRLFINGLTETDPNPVMAFFVVTAASVVVFNMIADIAYAYLDPRIRLS